MISYNHVVKNNDSDKTWLTWPSHKYHVHQKSGNFMSCCIPTLGKTFSGHAFRHRAFLSTAPFRYAQAALHGGSEDRIAAFVKSALLCSWVKRERWMLEFHEHPMGISMGIPGVSPKKWGIHGGIRNFESFHMRGIIFAMFFQACFGGLTLRRGSLSLLVKHPVGNPLAQAEWPEVWPWVQPFPFAPRTIWNSWSVAYLG